VNDFKNPYTTPPEDYFLWIRGKQLGGRLHTWGRVVLRMTDYDFKAARRDGHGLDWPISYRDIAPYYDEVEKFLGVYGSIENIPNLPNGKYTMTPKLTSLEQEFKANIEAEWPERSVIPWRYVSPNLKRVPLPILAAKETGRLTIRTDAVVKQINIDQATGKASGVLCIDRKIKKVDSYSANIVVLCASTIESIRLLLNSACPKYPDGLGNSSGLLGHYFMDQAPSIIFGSVPHSKGWEFDDSVPQDPFCPPHGGIYIPRFQNLDITTHSHFIRGFAFQGVVGGQYVPADHPAMFGLMGYGETLSNYDNCVTVNPKRKDAWGVPVPHIRFSFSHNEHKLMREQVRTTKGMAELCDFKINFAGNALGLDNGKDVYPQADWLSKFIFRKSFKKSLAAGAAIHECGGARMGNDPGKSILNSYNQCWDIKNLFVTDGSCFVSSGTVGPTLTIMALTVRTCEYIAREYEKGNL
jgi:choline dehydrogenase-like flavoprotein